MSEDEDLIPGFMPENFHYVLKARSDFSFFDGQHRGVISLTLSVGKGTPLRMYEARMPLCIGARLFAIDDPHTGAEREQLAEYRVDSEPFTVRKGGVYERALVVDLPVECTNRDLLLEIELVKENQFWLSSLGHPVLSLPIIRRHVMIAPGKDDTHDMSQALQTQDERRTRDARQEAIIFALLNQLSKRDGG